MPEQVIKWCHSDTEECFSVGGFATEEEAIADGESYGYDQDMFYVGQQDDSETSHPELAIDADPIVDRMGEYLYDLCGDASEGELHPNEGQRSQLTIALRETISAWLDENGLRPKCYVVTNVTEHPTLKDEDDQCQTDANSK